MLNQPFKITVGDIQQVGAERMSLSLCKDWFVHKLLMNVWLLYHVTAGGAVARMCVRWVMLFSVSKWAVHSLWFCRFCKALEKSVQKTGQYFKENLIWRKKKLNLVLIHLYLIHRSYIAANPPLQVRTRQSKTNSVACHQKRAVYDKIKNKYDVHI